MIDERAADDPEWGAEASAFLEAAMASTEDAVVGTDLRGSVGLWNAGAERLYGYTAQEVVGRDLRLLAPPEWPDEIPALLRRLAGGESIAHYETERVRKDRSRVHVSVNYWPVRDRAGAVVGAVAVSRDITRRRAAEAERERLLALAEQAVRERDAVVALVTHDLNHALAVVQLRADLLVEEAREREADPGPLAGLAGQVEAALRRMGALIRDLAETFRPEAEPPVRREADLAALARERVAEFRAAWPELRWELAVAGTVPSVACEAERLARVVDNVLQNAARYSPAGGTVRVGVGREGDRAVLAVADEGIGIPAADLPRVFEPGYRGRNAADRVRGSGLGLWGARLIAEHHGGTLEAASAGEGRGATLTLRLPPA